MYTFLNKHIDGTCPLHLLKHGILYCASQPHDSTGSTVDTFLSQDGLDTVVEFFPPLPTIPEFSDDDIQSSTAS